MLKETVKKLLQMQLTQERVNHATYSGFAAAIGNVGSRPGLEKWLKEGAEEEESHALQVAEYMQARNALPVFEALPIITAPAGDDLEAYFGAILSLEQVNTAKLQSLYLTALAEGDALTAAWVQPLMLGQVEDEKKLTDYLAMLKGLDRAGQLWFDHELGEGEI